MITKFDRIQIEAINKLEIKTTSKVGAINKKSVEVPHADTFKQVFEKAKKGNEFAAVLLDEWQKNCTPKNAEEKQVVELINKAATKIFK
jgi:hypothetical protein